MAYLNRVCYALLLVGALSLGRLGVAQGSIRGWHSQFFDTESRQGTAQRASAFQWHDTVVRSDGRLFIRGNNTNGACVPPTSAQYPFADVIANNDWAVGLYVGGVGVAVWGSGPTVPPAAPSLPAGTQYVQIARGTGHILALKSNGTVAVWGNNTYGNQYGQSNPLTLPPNVTVLKVGAGDNYSVALLSNGTIQCWGSNAAGQLNVPALPPGVGYVDFDAGTEHVLAIRSDGELVAWGSNVAGQCNVPPLPVGMVYQLVAGGESHSVALRSDGALLAWGNNWYGQLDVPAVPPGTTVLSLDAGYIHNIALLSNGKLLEWAIPLPSLPEGAGGTQIASFSHLSNFGTSLTVLSTGVILGWGGNDFGQATPPTSFAGHVFTQAETGGMHSVALRQDGQVFAWGSNFEGRLNVPALPPGLFYTDIVVGGGHSVAIRSDGTAVGWGQSLAGQCNIPAPPIGVTYIGAAVGWNKTVMLRSDNGIEYLGYSQPWQASAPTLPAGVRWSQLAVGTNYIAGLRSDGQVQLWGGVNPTLPAWRAVPPLPFGVYYVEVDGGDVHTMLRRSDGTVDACGEIYYGQHLAPPLAPGTSYLRISTEYSATAIVGPRSTYVSIGAGCAGSRPATRLVPRDTPFVGKTLKVTLFDLPANVGLMTMGWQALPAPVSLAALGMPGCYQYATLDGTALLVGQNNTTEWSLPIPNAQSLVGLHFFNQALVLDPAAGNGFGAVVSDAAEGVVGVL